MAEGTFKLTRGFALTGSIGVGKSTVMSCLKRRGWRVIESDQLARELVCPGRPAHREIREAFGEEFFKPSGELDRARLGEAIFSDESKRRRLEAILHPRIRKRWQSEARQAESKGEWVAVEIPLLFETGAEKFFKQVVVVACSEAHQLGRLRKNRLWTEQEARRRLKVQIGQQEKMDRADFVIWNDFEPEEAERQLAPILEAVLKN